MSEQRLQKTLAQAGIASRRAAEELIKAGRVRVNGKVVTELGTKVKDTDNVEVDERKVAAERYVYFAFHKPRGVVSTMSDPEGRKTVKDFFTTIKERVFPVGRLDFHTSGVLLVTNDGAFADGLMHPRKAVPKTYVVKTSGAMTIEDLDAWRNGIDLEDGRTLPAEALFLRHEEEKTWFELTIREGRNQQIRRMGEATNFPVMRLARVAFAGISGEGLRPGDWRPLGRTELDALKKEYGVPKKVSDPSIENAADSRVKRRPAQRSFSANEGTSPRGRSTERGARDRGPSERDGRDERKARPTRPTSPRGDGQHGRRSDASRGDSPRTDSYRSDSPRSDSPRSSSPRNDAPREGYRGRSDAPREGGYRGRSDAPREGGYRGRSDAPRSDSRGGPSEGRRPAPSRGRDSSERSPSRGGSNEGGRAPYRSGGAGDGGRAPYRGKPSDRDGAPRERAPRAEGSGDRERTPYRAGPSQGRAPSRDSRDSGRAPYRGKPSDRSSRDGDSRGRSSRDDAPRGGDSRGPSRGPRGGAPRDSAPRGDAPRGDAPRGRSNGGRPSAGRPTGGRPSGGRPSGGRSSGGDSSRRRRS